MNSQESQTANQTQDLPKELGKELQASLDQTAKDLNLSDLGVSVGVVTPEGKWSGAAGISNLETQEATQTDDLFNIASTSKPFTSAVILRLQEQGKLSLDDTIDQWLPEIAEKIPDGENLTIRQILNGTGGLWDYFNDSEEFTDDLAADYASGSTRDWQPEDLVAYAFDKPPFSGDSSTGQWTYTNTGNVIAALIAEKATGKPFKEILASEILQPLGLKNTFFTSEDADLSQRARGYDDSLTEDGNRGQDGILEDYSFVDTGKIAYGPGSIVASAEDLAVFYNSLASGDLLQPESTAEIFNYVDVQSASNSNGDNSVDPPSSDTFQFGLGVAPSKLPWCETRSTNGEIYGYTSDVDYLIDSDTTISVLANQSSPKADLARAAFRAAIVNTLALSDAAIAGTENQESLTGTEANDVINGLAGDDTIAGQDGLDALDGGQGNDSLEGGSGELDVLFGKENNDLLNGGKGIDILNGGDGDDQLNGGDDTDFLLGGQGSDLLNGNEGLDILDGGAGNDRLKDTAGVSALYGNEGDDWLFAGMDNDTLYGEAGNDQAIANEGDDQLFGGLGSDNLNGGLGDDQLFGGEGDDLLTGGKGSDSFTGDGGSDRFMLATGGTDTITDFTDGQDLLYLPENIAFEDLAITQGQGDNAANVLISFQEQTLAILSDINVEGINQDDFALSGS
jgi:D-alanyl-D-alanine carboxypeptidase